jgi:hypothetical protein
MIKFIKSVINALAMARKRQAAMAVAQHLVNTNKDFKHLGVHEVYNRIMDEKNPTYLDGTSVEKS